MKTTKNNANKTGNEQRQSINFSGINKKAGKEKMKPGPKPTGKAGGKKLIYFSFDALQIIDALHIENVSRYIQNLIIQDWQQRTGGSGFQQAQDGDGGDLGTRVI